MSHTPPSTHNVRTTVGSRSGAGAYHNVLGLHVPRPGPLDPRTLQGCGGPSPRCFPASSTYRSSTPGRGPWGRPGTGRRRSRWTGPGVLDVRGDIRGAGPLTEIWTVA